MDKSAIIIKLKNIFSAYESKHKNLLKSALALGFLISASYVLASVTSDMIMIKLADSIKIKKITTNDSHVKFPKVSKMNYTIVSRDISKRNIFNHENKFPSEKINDKASQEKTSFNLNSKCQKTKLDIKLLGILFSTKRSDSIAVIKDKNYSQADYYREGEYLIENENVQIVKINSFDVVLNNSGVKECLNIVLSKLKMKEEDFFDEPEEPKIIKKKTVISKDTNIITLQEKYVSEQLGPGFAKIINKARLVPNIVNNEITGFKIFAIRSPSLWSKIGIEESDVITRVNDKNLKKPELGFAVYEAFQNEQDIILYVDRMDRKKTITIKIK